MRATVLEQAREALSNVVLTLRNRGFNHPPNCPCDLCVVIRAIDAAAESIGDAMDLTKILAEMTLEGECEACGWQDEDAVADGNPCPRCGGSLYEVSAEDALSTLNDLIASARKITGISPRKRSDQCNI